MGQLYDNDSYHRTDNAARRARKGKYSRHLDLRKNRDAPGKSSLSAVHAFCRRFMRIIDKQIKIFMTGEYII